MEHSRTCKSKPTNVQNYTHIWKEFSFDSKSWWCNFPDIQTKVSLFSFYLLAPFSLFLGPLRQCFFLLLTHLIYLFNLMEVSIFRSICNKRKFNTTKVKAIRFQLAQEKCVKNHNIHPHICLFLQENLQRV